MTPFEGRDSSREVSERFEYDHESADDVFVAICPDTPAGASNDIDDNLPDGPLFLDPVTEAVYEVIETMKSTLDPSTSLLLDETRRGSKYSPRSDESSENTEIPGLETREPGHELADESQEGAPERFEYDNNASAGDGPEDVDEESANTPDRASKNTDDALARDASRPDLVIEAVDSVQYGALISAALGSMRDDEREGLKTRIAEFISLHPERPEQLDTRNWDRLHNDVQAAAREVWTEAANVVARAVTESNQRREFLNALQNWTDPTRESSTEDHSRQWQFWTAMEKLIQEVGERLIRPELGDSFSDDVSSGIAEMRRRERREQEGGLADQLPEYGALVNAALGSMDDVERQSLKIKSAKFIALHAENTEQLDTKNWDRLDSDVQAAAREVWTEAANVVARAVTGSNQRREFLNALQHRPDPTHEASTEDHSSHWHFWTAIEVLIRDLARDLVMQLTKELLIEMLFPGAHIVLPPSGLVDAILTACTLLEIAEEAD